MFISNILRRSLRYAVYKEAVLVQAKTVVKLSIPTEVICKICQVSK